MSLARATGHSIGGKQKYPPIEAHLALHPSMYRTDTLDMFTLAYAEIYRMTDTTKSCSRLATLR